MIPRIRAEATGAPAHDSRSPARRKFSKEVGPVFIRALKRRLAHFQYLLPRSPSLVGALKGPKGLPWALPGPRSPARRKHTKG